MTSLPSIGFLKLILVLLLGSYLIMMVFAFSFGNRLTFPAPPSGYIDSSDIVKFTYSESGESVSMVYLNSPGSPYLVFFHHGNGEDLQYILPWLEALRRAGFSVLAWDYPGYGTSDGKPTEQLINRIASRIMQSIPDSYGYPLDHVIHYGRSVGSGPAIRLAGELPSAGLILEGAFTSVFRVVTRVRLLPWDIFDNLAYIGSIQCPVLFIHGTADRTVPFHHGQSLFEKAPEEKFFAWFESGGHNNLIAEYSDTYRSSITRFREFLDSRMR